MIIIKKNFGIILFAVALFGATFASDASAGPGRDPICIKVPGGQDICEW